MMVKKRFDHIDLMESIAIFLVILYHGTLYAFNFLELPSAWRYAAYAFRTILSVCVPLFFFANGYLLLNKEFDLKKHITKTVRLVALTIVWAFVLMPIYLLISGEPFSIATVVKSILNVSTEWSMEYFWFMGAIVGIYILLPALKALFDSNRKAFVFLTAALAVFSFGLVFIDQAASIAGMLLKRSIPSVKQPIVNMFDPLRGPYSYSFVYFCVGGLAFCYEDRILALLFLVGLALSRKSGEVWDVVWNGYPTVFTFFAVLFIYVLSLNYTKGWAFVRNISYNTLGIYFLHGLALRLTRPHIKTIELLRNVPANIVYAFAVLCCCLGVCMLLKKIPGLKNLV